MKNVRRTASPAPAAARPRSRRGLIVAAGALLLALGAWWWLRTPAFVLTVNPERNVLLVTIDTLRADALGAYGGRATTPNLNQLAAHGARFDFAHSHAVVTLVSHASILTGHYPYEHGIRDNSGYRLAPTEPTAATRLKALGFATGAFIGGFPLDHRFGLATGFDLYDDHLNQATADSSDRERRADLVVGSALNWIGKQSSRWFAFVHVYDPHAPYQPPPEWATRFASEPYLGEVSWTDAALGVLFDRLASQPRPTLVVVTGDHGESLGEHGELTHSLFAYESTLHVPLIVSEIAGSAGAGAGRRAPQANGVAIESAVRHVDIVPTLLDAVGASADPTLAGTSLRSVISAGGGADRPTYFEAMTANVTRSWAPLRGVIVEHRKYIDLPIEELYDLPNDPDETTNLATVRTDRVEVLQSTLRNFNVAPPGRPAQESAETIDRLRSLGYIGGGSSVIRVNYSDADDPKRLIELEQTMHRAGDLARGGKLDDAASLYRMVIGKRADMEDAYRQLALLYWRQGRQRDAIQTLESALANGVTQSEVRIKLGQYLAESDEPGKAIELLQSTAGDDPDALVVLGNAYWLAGRQTEALNTFSRVIELDPQSGLGYENLGIAQLRLKDFAGAEQSLRKAIGADPALSNAYTALGVALANSGRPGEAIDTWKRAVTLDPGDLDALFNLTKTLAEQGRVDEARPFGQRYLAAAPQSNAADIELIKKLIGA
jgi:arylsulfatase A-like enzyme/tetratricopeptide (TPR) repeat protein